VPRKRLHKHARQDKKNGRLDKSTLPYRPDASHKKSGKKKKKGEIVEKYFPNNFQNTHVYKADIPVQLAFQKNQNIIAS